MNHEEEALFKKLLNISAERQYLLKIYEEVDSLIRSGYDGPFMGEDIRGVTSSVLHYKNWIANGQDTKKTIDS